MKSGLKETVKWYLKMETIEKTKKLLGNPTEHDGKKGLKEAVKSYRENLK